MFYKLLISYALSLGPGVTVNNVDVSSPFLTHRDCMTYADHKQTLLLRSSLEVQKMEVECVVGGKK